MKAKRVGAKRVSNLQVNAWANDQAVVDAEQDEDAWEQEWAEAKEVNVEVRDGSDSEHTAEGQENFRSFTQKEAANQRAD